MNLVKYMQSTDCFTSLYFFYEDLLKYYTCLLKKIYYFQSKLKKPFNSNRKNYNFLDCNWFKKLLFSLIHLPSYYWTVCYQTVQ